MIDPFPLVVSDADVYSDKENPSWIVNECKRLWYEHVSYKDTDTAALIKLPNIQIALVFL